MLPFQPKKKSQDKKKKKRETTTTSNGALWLWQGSRLTRVYFDPLVILTFFSVTVQRAVLASLLSSVPFSSFFFLKVAVLLYKALFFFFCTFLHTSQVRELKLPLIAFLLRASRRTSTCVLLYPLVGQTAAEESHTLGLCFRIRVRSFSFFSALPSEQFDRRVHSSATASNSLFFKF